jgi:hypothetical protein
MGTKSRETIYGGSIRASAQRAAEARKQADRLACEAWNARMLGYKGPAQPSPTLGDALNAGYLYLEVPLLDHELRRPYSFRPSSPESQPSGSALSGSGRSQSRH